LIWVILGKSFCSSSDLHELIVDTEQSTK